MTEKDLKAVYNNMSLSEDRIKELEKRLDKCFEEAERNTPEIKSEIEFMQFDSEYKPMKKRRPAGIVFGSCAAAVLVVAAGFGFFTAYKNGYLPVKPKDTPTDVIQPAETLITADMLPDYPDKGVLDAPKTFFDDIGTTYADVCQDDWKYARISDTQLVVAVTITDIFPSSRTDISSDAMISYNAKVDKSYFNLLGYDIENCTIDFTLDSTANMQFVGFPPFYVGDRVLVALKAAGGMTFKMSAAYAVADILTVDGIDYAAVRSDLLAGLDIGDYSEGQPIDRTTTVTGNHVKYYGIYDVDSLGMYLAGKAEQSQTYEKPLNGMFTIDDLKFRNDEAGMSIFEKYFIGRWSDDSYESMLLSYTQDDIADGRYYLCTGFAENSECAYMLIGAAESDVFTLYCVNKSSPDEIYTYPINDAPEYSRATYKNHYTLSGKEEPTDIASCSYLGYFGRMKLKAKYNNESFSTAIDDVFLSGSAEFDGRTWNRNYVRPDMFDISAERDQLIAMEPDHVAFTIRLYDSEAQDFVTEPTNNYRERPVCRNFKVDLKSVNGEWSYSLTSLSGFTDDMAGFWLPLENGEQYASLRYGFDKEKTIGVRYFGIPAENGMTAVIAVRQLKDEDSETELYQIFWRDPVCDEYIRLNTMSTFDYVIDDDDGMVYYSGKLVDGNSVVCSVDGKMNTPVYYLNDTENSVTLYVRGDYLLLKRITDSGVQWAVFDKQTLEYPVLYDENNLVLTDNDFNTFESEWIATNKGIVSVAYENSDVKEVYHNGANDGIYSSLLKLDSRAKAMWHRLVVGSADSVYTDNPKTIVRDDEQINMYQLADPQLRTREGMLQYLETVLTPQAAEEALQYLFTIYYQEIDGEIYTTGGERGADLTYGAAVPNVSAISESKNSGEITYTVYYDSHDGEGNLLPDTESYTIPWERTDNGIRLGRFYYPF